MSAITTRQMLRALDAARELAEIRELEDFPARASDVMREMLACEHCGYTDVDLESGHATVVANPREAVFPGGPELLAQLGRQNPLIVRALAGDTAVQRLSDHITHRQLHRTQLYQDVYRRSALEYQLGFQLRPVGRSLGGPGHLIALSLARRHRDFSASDMLMLELLRPHFIAALERLHALALTDALLAGLATERDRWLVLVDGADVVAWASEDAGRKLGVRVGERLSLDPVLFSVRRLAAAYPGLDALHVRRSSPPAPDALRGLGLTERQSEVLALAIRGLGAREIADALVLSRRTVEKHFEAIYSRLGVRTRAQAIAAAFSAVGGV